MTEVTDCTYVYAVLPSQAVLTLPLSYNHIQYSNFQWHANNKNHRSRAISSPTTPMYGIAHHSETRHEIAANITPQLQCTVSDTYFIMVIGKTQPILHIETQNYMSLKSNYNHHFKIIPTLEINNIIIQYVSTAPYSLLESFQYSF